MIVKEMVESGNYFIPKVYGMVDFDKPILSHWAMLPFTWISGLTESSLRMPSALAGVATVLLIYDIGRRLFGTAAGVIGSFILLTTVMFVFWARVASAEMLNLLGIWFMFWSFLAGAQAGRLGYTILLYSAGAVAAFLKGPVAPAASLSTLVLYSSVSALLRWKDLKQQETSAGWESWRRASRSEFRWLASRQGLAGVSVGLAFFLLLLLLPVLMTGSWIGVQLMWKENVVRFFSPFDHRGPVYTYFVYTLMFSAPWTLLVIAALWEVRRLPPGRARRWASLVAAGIFAFFTLSGSRRSYYILPLAPALAIIAGAVISNWVAAAKQEAWPVIRGAALATSGLIATSGLAIIYAAIYTYPLASTLHLILQFAASLAAILGGSLALYLFIKKRAKEGLVTLLSFVLVINLWVFNAGMEFAEAKRTLRPFCVEATRQIDRVESRKVALFGEDASLLFYLNRRGLNVLNSAEQIKQFQEEHPDGFLIADLDILEESGKLQDRGSMKLVLAQRPGANETRGQYALFRFAPGQPSQ